MPKKKHELPSEYLSWLKYVPEAQQEQARTEWLANPEVKKLPNLVGGMNEAQREAAEWRQKAAYGQQLTNSLTPYQDVINQLPEYAHIMRRYSARDLAQLANQQQQQPANPTVAIQQTQALQDEVRKQMQQGNMDWTEGQQEILRLEDRLNQMSDAVQRFNTFTEQQVPGVLNKWEQQLGALDKRRRDDNLEMIGFQTRATQYFQQHPERDPTELYTALKENPASFGDFDALVTSVYGEEDLEAQLARVRAEERKKVTSEYEERAKTAQPTPGEAIWNTGESALVRRRRTQENTVRPPFPKDDGEKTERLRNFFQQRSMPSTA